MLFYNIMDLFAGLSAVSTYFNNNQKPIHDKINTGQVKRDEINGDNIYDSNEVRQGRRFMKKIASERNKQARRPLESGVVPNLYNQYQFIEKQKKENFELAKKMGLIETFGEDADSVFSDASSIGNQSRKSNDSIGLDHTAFFKKSNILLDNPRHVKKFEPKLSDNGESGFMAQFQDLEFNNPSNPVSSNSIPNQTGNYAGISRLENERDLALKGHFSSFNPEEEQTYGVVSPENFSHNNMVPFFKSGIGKGYGPDSDTTRKWTENKQRKVDLFTGSLNNPQYRPKTERRPLFNPLVGLTNIYGMPNFTDYMETRYIPGRERRNEKPMQEVRVTPGLNLGYNEVSKQGFNDTFRVLPPTVDELRTANNPKISYGKPIIPGMKGERRPIIPNVAKRRPETFAEQDPRDMVKSLGYYRAPSIYGNYDAPSTNRQMTSRAWYSAAAMDPTIPKPESLMEHFRTSFKTSFKADPAHNVTGVEKDKSYAFDYETNIPDPTMRNTTENRDWINPAGPNYKKGTAFDMKTNIPDPTLRNTTEKRDWLNPAAPNWQREQAFDMKTNIPDPTLRNTTERNTNIRPVTTDWKQTYAWDTKTNIPDPTLRNTTERNTNIRPVTTEWKQTYAWDTKTNIPDPTLRNTTERNTNIRPVTTEWKQTYAWDTKTNIPDPTLRNTTEINSNLRPATTEWKQTYAWDSKTNIPDPTLRNTTEINSNLRPVTTEWKKGTAFDMKSNIPDPTIRNTTEINGYLAPTTTDWKKGTAFDMKSNIPDPTIRNTTEINGYLAPTTTEWKKGTAFDMKSNIPDPTMRNTTEVNGYLAPTTTEWKKGGYQAEQAGTIVPPTLRQLTQNNTYLNPAGFPEKEKGGYQAEQAGTIAPTTLRQLTQNNTYQGPTILHGAYKERTREDAMNSMVNVGRDSVSVRPNGGAPTPSNYTITPTYEHTMVQMCEPIQINRDIYPDMNGQRPLQCTPTMYTRLPNELPQQSWRFDTCVVNNLNSNPFVNNTQHKSVEY